MRSRLRPPTALLALLLALPLPACGGASRPGARARTSLATPSPRDEAPDASRDAPAQAVDGAAAGPVCGTPVATVDLDELALEGPDRPEINRRLKARFDALQRDLERRSAALNVKKERFDREFKALPADEAKRRTDELQAELYALQRDFVAAQEELKRYEAELTGEARERARAYVRKLAPELAREYGLLAIYDKRAPIWAHERAAPGALRGRARFDLTDAVLVRYQKEPGLGPDTKI